MDNLSNRKRILKLIAASVLILGLFTFTACGKDDDTESGSQTQTQTTTESSQDDTVPEASTQGESVDDRDANADNTGEEADQEDQESQADTGSVQVNENNLTSQQSSSNTSTSNSQKSSGNTAKSGNSKNSGSSAKSSNNKSSDSSAKSSNNKNSGSSAKSSKKSSGSSTQSSKKSSSESSSNNKQKKKVWVEPVYETRTVNLDTGTRYCGGVNNGTKYGTCSQSWHGTKDDTYNKWRNHWQDYVARRTKEEEEKGKIYVCDHVHDDSKWVPDTTTEQVLVKEGYWKEVD